MLKWWFRGFKKVSSNPWDLDATLLKFGARDRISLGEACMGMLILGATGSGKTTGPGAAAALACLRKGMGGLILCCKPGERKLWEEYCRQTGRIHNVAVFDASGKHRFAFLDEELKRAGAGAGLTENIVNLLSTILEIAERSSGQGGREDEGYWKRANRQLARNLVELLVLAKGRVTIPELYRLVISAPTSRLLLADASWKSKSFCFQCLAEAENAPKTKRQQYDYNLVADYFTYEFPNLSDKTRSVIVSTFTSMIDVLNRSLLRELFTEGTTVRPEDTFDGKIIIVDLAIKEFAEVGQFAAVLWKYCWQKAVERRDVSASTRPVFLFADEFQNFLVEYDQQFQTTARSARAISIYLTQNISNLLAAFGGTQAQAYVDSILGNMQVKFWCGNGDNVTNEHASQTIGRVSRFFINTSHTPEDFNFFDPATWGSTGRITTGMSEQLEYDCDPRVFTQLRGGGPRNAWTVDAILFQAGKVFSTGKSWMMVSFKQQFLGAK